MCTGKESALRTFVKLDAELVLDVELLREIVLVKLRPDDVAKRRRAGEGVGGSGGESHCR